MIWRYLKFGLLIVTLLSLAGCSLFGANNNENSASINHKNDSIMKFDGEMSRAISYVNTTSKLLSLTFNGLGDKETIKELLNLLDQLTIKATFFVPGMRVAEEPELALEIINRGHELESNTLSKADLTTQSYAEIYKSIRLTNEILEREAGVTPNFLRTGYGNINEDVQLAAAHNGIQAVIIYSLNFQSWKDRDPNYIKENIMNYITRGGIIALDTEDNPRLKEFITILAEAVQDTGYQLVPLSKLIALDRENKPVEQIKGYDAARINMDYENVPYEVVYSGNPDRMEIALTFDDWGTDYTVTKILGILERYQVKSTFFLRANGVQANPNLAKAIAEAGHEIANHTYSHPVITTITPEQLQEQVVKSHQIMTEAIQEQPLMLFRPPTGVYDDKTAKIVAATGYTTIAMYDVTTLDWDINNDAEAIRARVANNVMNGSVVLMHILDGLHTIEALPMVIEDLLERGYSLVKMSDMLDLK